MTHVLFRLVAVAVSIVAGTAITMTPASAADKHAAITIQANDQFDAAHGVRSGSGTAEDPYVISGWQVNNVLIENTDRHVTIRNNVITGRLTLNWIGDRARVSSNAINDLRVNQNAKRTGQPTSGAIWGNTFRVVGQLRHWDGIFERNVVGAKDNLRARAVNFDGFNGAQFRGNTIYGSMDARLHGHHHSSSFDAGSHQHAGGHGTHGIDHTRRYHRVSIVDNTISTTANYALAYLDTNHAANDRKAASEQEEDLTLPHVHHTRVQIAGNRLSGAGILVNVFNAPDAQKHERTARGTMQIIDNRISLGADDFWAFRDLHGIEVKQALDMELLIEGNRIAGQKADDGFFSSFDANRNAGIFVHALDKASISILDNGVTQRAYGVRAEQFTDTVRWIISDLRTSNVEQAVYTDKTVKDSPNE